MDKVASRKRGRGRRKPEAPERRKVALVLSGGGIPGWMYEIGALTALDEFFTDGFDVGRFDLYVGTSAGAAAAALLAGGIPPRAVYDAIVEDADSPFNFRRRDIYTFGTGETWAMLKKIAAMAGPVVGQIARRVLRREAQGASMLDLVYTIQESLPSGLFTLAPLERHLERMLNEAGAGNDFRHLPRPLFVPAVDLDRGLYRIFGTPGWDHVPISRAVAASSAVPVLFQPVQIEGADYIDGGTGRVANMDVAVDHGAGLLVVVNPVVHLDNDRRSTCLPTCYGFCNGLKSKGMAFVADQALRINTGMRLRIAKAQQEYLFPGLQIVIIEPDPHETVMFTQNVMAHDSRKDILRYGYRATAQYLIDRFEELEAAFGRFGIGVTLSAFRHRPRTGGFRVLGPNERTRVPGAQPVNEPG
jgi:NTE family protein